MKKQQSKIDITKQKFELFINLVKKFWIIIIAVTIIFGALGGVIARLTYTPEYTVTQAFTINVNKHPELNSTSMTDSQLSATIPSLLSSEIFVQHMKPIIKQAKAEGKFKVSSLSNTNIFYLTVVARTNKDALKIIELIQKHYPDIAIGIVGESEIEYFTEPSTSHLPSNAPNYAIGIVAGALFGFIIVIALIILKAVTTKVISTSAEAEELTKSKCLSVFNTKKIKQRSNTKDKQKYKMPLINSDDCELDLLQSVATLSNNIETICAKKEHKSILMTSTISGEGKSSICINLALSLADKGNKVVIVDADLRTPSIANYLGISKLNGLLTKVIDNEEKLENAITNISDSLFIVGDTNGSDMAFEKATSKRLTSIINQLEESFDYVIVDAAPVGILGDAVAIADAVDGFIYVISHNYINQHALLRGLSELDSSSAKMLGCVLNYKNK